MEPFIKIQRKILEWEWFSDAKTLQVWIYILAKANWEPKKWRGITINRGETLETVQGICNATGLSTQSVRTALNHLKATNEITVSQTRYGSLISAVNWGKYQAPDVQANNQANSNANNEPTNCQQRANKELTTPKELKEYKELKERKELRNILPKTPKQKHGEFGHVLLTETEFEKLQNDYSNAEELIRFLDEYIEMKGYQAKNHYLAIRKWVVDAVQDQRERPKRKELPF